MTFLDASMLVALVAMAIPLAVHLLGRRRARRMVLPTMRLAEGVHQASRGWMWLRRAGLMGLRLAAVACLVLALAGPQIGARRPGPAWVLCLDTSPSMGAAAADGTTALARARQRLLDLLDRLPPRVPVDLLTSDGRRLGGTAAAAREAVQGFSASGVCADPLGRMVRRAAQMAPSADGRLVLATDATPWALRDLDAAALKALEPTVLVVPVGATTENTWLGLPEARVSDSPQGRTLDVSVSLLRTGPVAAAEVFLQLDGAAEKHAAVVPAGGPAARFSIPVQGTGPWQGRVWTADDALPADSVRYFTAAAPAPIRLLVVDAAGEASARIRSADLVAAAFSGDVPTPKRVTVLRASQANPAAMEAADVVFWVGHQTPDPDHWLAALLEQVRLVWMPGAPDPPPPVRPDPAPMKWPVAGDPLRGPEDVPEGATIDAAGYGSALLAAFEGGTSGDLGQPVFGRRLALTETPGASVIRFRDGRPAILDIRRPKGGRSVFLAFGPAPYWGDLAGRAEFVVLMHSLAEALAPAPGPRVANLVIGGRAPLRIPVSEPAAGNSSDAAGLFWSWNVDPEETADLRPQPERLTAAFRADRVRVVQGPWEAENALFEGSSGGPTDLTPYLAIALAAVLAAETVLAATGSGASRDRSAAA